MDKKLSIDLDQVVQDAKDEATKVEPDAKREARERATEGQRAVRKEKEPALPPTNAELLALVVALYDRVSALEKAGTKVVKA